MSRLIRRQELEHMVGLKKSAIYDLIRKNLFPKAVRIGTKHVAWRLEEVQEWIDNRPRVDPE